MLLSEVFLASGEPGFRRLIRSISMGKLRTYQLFDALKTRAHLPKLNTETLEKATPRLWARLAEHDEDFAKDLGQTVLVSNLPLIIDVLDFVGIPHDGGFFAKDEDPGKYLTDDWQDRVLNQFRDKYPEPLLIFYVNHLAWEVNGAEAQVFRPSA
jgi:hypothetical protein